jgi:hypothetical protein
MDRSVKRKVAAGAAALFATAGGGAAIAATQWSPNEQRQTVLKDAADRLGVQPGELSAALKSALKKRVDDAVAAGRMTKAEGDELKQRIDSSDFPLLGFGPRSGPGKFEHHELFRGLDAAASYLGVTADELRSSLDSGKSLADVAKAHGKSVDGLVQTLVADAKKHLDEAVAGGRITKAQETQMLSRLEEGIRSMVNGQRPQLGPRRGFGFRHDFDGPLGHHP